MDLNIIQNLIGFESVTPLGKDCLEYIGELLTTMGFKVEIEQYGAVHNMFAKLNREGPHLCFAGHVDVVPPGNSWKNSPYSLTEIGSYFSGLGIVDMKGAIGCFIYALQKNIGKIKGSVSIMLTTDEEAEAVDGIQRYIKESKSIKNDNFDIFILGEPSCNKYAGDAVKIGRRGSVTATLNITGSKGHIAYPHYAHSAINPLSELISLLHNREIGEKNDFFEASKIQITEIKTGDNEESAENVIPGSMKICFGTRFNSNYTADQIIEILSKEIKKTCANHNINHSISWKKHGEPFILKNKSVITWLENNIFKETNQKVNFNANGATSDGRFLTKLADVVEIGLEESQAHQTEEKTLKENISTLYNIYSNLLLDLHNLNK